MRRSIHAVMPVVPAICAASIPLYPSYITLTNVAFPGVSVIPPPFTLALIAFDALMVLYAIVALLSPPRERQPLLWPMLGVAAACTLSTIFGFNPRDGAVFVTIFVMTVVWHCVIVRYYNTMNTARWLYWSYVVSGTLAALAALVMVATRFPAAQYAIGNGRAIGTFVLPGELAGYLIVFLPMTFALVRVARSRALRVASFAGLAIGSVAMLLTFSRAGWTGLASAIAFFIAVRARARHAGLAAGAAIVAAALLLVLLNFNAHHNPSENYTRLSIWQAAIQVIDRFPLTGVGPFGFSRLYALVRLPDGDATAFHAHSVYLTFLAELGVVGCAAFVWLGWAFVAELRRRLRTADPDAAYLALAIAAGLAGTLVQGLIDTVSVVIFGLLLSTMALALAAARDGTAGA